MLFRSRARLLLARWALSRRIDAANDVLEESITTCRDCHGVLMSLETRHGCLGGRDIGVNRASFLEQCAEIGLSVSNFGAAAAAVLRLSSQVVGYPAV